MEKEMEIIGIIVFIQGLHRDYRAYIGIISSDFCGTSRRLARIFPNSAKQKWRQMPGGLTKKL